MRIDYHKAAPAGVRAVYALDHYVRASGLEPELIELVKVRASLMNGVRSAWTFTPRMLEPGERPSRRLFAAPVWHETPFFSPRERAALAWTESVTEIGRSGVSDALHDEARTQFTDQELVDLTFAVIAINAWNRLAVTFQPVVGNFKPAAATTAAPAFTSV